MKYYPIITALTMEGGEAIKAQYVTMLQGQDLSGATASDMAECGFYPTVSEAVRRSNPLVNDGFIRWNSVPLAAVESVYNHIEGVTV